MDLSDLILRLLMTLALLCLALILRRWSQGGARTNQPPPTPLPPPSGARATGAPVGGIATQVGRHQPLQLDVARFSPLRDDQARQAARGLGTAWGSVWFGRRDLIPPADDPRTNLIDRAMVAHGFVTPDELLEVHQVGAEMDAIRPDLAQAGHTAARVVAEDRARRQHLKDQLRAEAAERKRRHVEAVALRKSSDIIYLGRGVSKALADRVSDQVKLQALGIPVLATPGELAAAMGLPIPRLRWLAFHSEASTVSHYVRFSVPKRSGGMRHLAAPRAVLAAAQAWVRTEVLEKIPKHQSVHGFISRRSTVTNAWPHTAREVVVNADLQDFFPSITFARVQGVFRQLGYSGAVATILGLLCTESPRQAVTYGNRRLYVASGPRVLPQGACTSPALSNLVARRLDSRLSGLAKKLEWTYTRYADDLSFSADNEAAQKIGYLLARIRHIAEDEGFQVNETKTRVLRQNTAQKVTGIIVNREPTVERATIRRLRAILHRAKTEGLASQNRENRPNFEAWLRGMIAYVSMVNSRQGQALRAALAEVTGSRGGASPS